ncbi:hypothetical protein NPX99_06765 [Bartonella sp. 220]|nr:hypothetical protein [Bartonella sp. 220B]MCZ2158967.1 hypothetical protein [Bartonella sp. 220B]
MKEQGETIFGADPSTDNCYGKASKECMGVMEPLILYRFIQFIRF